MDHRLRSWENLRLNAYVKATAEKWRCFLAKDTGQLLGIEWMNQLPPLTKAFDDICFSVSANSPDDILANKLNSLDSLDN